jgi:hypothetical protein
MISRSPLDYATASEKRFEGAAQIAAETSFNDGVADPVCSILGFFA